MTNTNDPKHCRIRCAIYARCAAANLTSLAEQIKKCAEYAEKQGWTIAREFVLADNGASGVSLTGCTSLARLLEGAMAIPRPYDCVLLADISRLGRSFDRVKTLADLFGVCGVFIQTVRGQFDTRKIRFISPLNKSSDCPRQ